jgi:hypothetical protein
MRPEDQANACNAEQLGPRLCRGTQPTMRPSAVSTMKQVRSGGDRSGVDHLVDPAVVARPDQHDVDTGGTEDQREFIIGLPDIGSLDAE